MTDQDAGSQRVPEPVLAGTMEITAEQMPHGHRKITGGLATLLSGEIVGQDVVKYLWDSVIEILNGLAGMTLEPMPEHVAARMFGLLAMFAFYQTKEKP